MQQVPFDRRVSAVRFTRKNGLWEASVGLQDVLAGLVSPRGTWQRGPNDGSSARQRLEAEDVVHGVRAQQTD